MSHQQQPHTPSFPLERIALFSDAVFAIAITLLIIEIKVPSLPYEDPAFSHEFAKAMWEMFPEFVGFFISFSVIGSYWRAHHFIFNYAIDYDRKLIRLNTLFLLTIVTMPFTTAFMSRYLFFQPFLIYAINVICSGLFQIRLWRYITGPRNNLHSTLPKGLRLYKTAIPLATISCFFLAILIHALPLPGDWAAFSARMMLISIFFVNSRVSRYYKKRYQFTPKD